MRIKFTLFALALALGFSKTQAAPGDTTWVQAHNDVWLDYYNDFDQAVTFPDGTQSYQRILMVFTLGKYVCPGTPEWCSDWDYTVQNFLMTPGGDTIELGRLITPYAKGPAMPASWKRDYVFDVTDYYPLLKNNNDVRIHYSGYSGGFTANIRFAFIEGQRDRDVKELVPLWRGSWAYGKASDPINTHLPVYSHTVPAGAVSEALHLNITGHGSDPNYCSEFCSKYYRLYHNGAMVAQHDIWRDNCGLNQLYPQSGTWIYDRANWCPGDLVHKLIHNMDVTAGATDSLRVAFQDYTSDGSASYTFSGLVLYYGDWNKSKDAGLEAIIAPTSDKTFFRENLSCARPMVRVKNRGAAALTSLKFSYGLAGSPMETFTWTGSLASGATADISLPPFAALQTATGAQTFSVEITEVNGAAGDEEAANNSLESTFSAPAAWKTELVFTLKTNNATAAGVSETSYRILDADDNVVFSRVGADPGTVYSDTLSLPPNCYRLVVEDEGCDGLSWWANPGAGNGSLIVTRKNSNIPYPMDHYFNGDFGCGFTQYFRTEYPAGVPQTSAVPASMEVYPNPASNQLSVALYGIDRPAGDIWIMDATGRRVLQAPVAGSNTTLDVSRLSAGVYLMTWKDSEGRTPRVTRQFTIAR